MKLRFYQIFLCLFLGASAVFAQTTEFSYQGKLDDGGNPANTTYEMQFRLFDNANAGQGTQQGTTVTKPAVQVVGGIFTVQLDFGSASFAAGADRYLEVSIRPAGSTGGYTALAPRQKLTAAPYAIKSLSANTAETATNSTQLGGVAANQYVQTNDSRLTDARTPLPGSGSYIQNTETTQAASNFNISGKGQANAFNATSHFELRGAPVLKLIPNELSSILLGYNSGTANATGGFNTILGFRSGSSLTTGNFNTFVGADSGGGTTTGFANIFIGDNVGSVNTTGSNNTIIGGYLAADNLTYATAIGRGANVGTSNTVVIGRGDDTVRIPGKLNIGGSGTGTGALCLNANTFIVGLCSSSRRFKTNIAPYRSGLELINRLQPVTFNWKDGNLPDFGLIAEDASEVEPLLATHNQQGELQGVKYDRVAVILVNAVKEQQQQIAEQKETNKRLQEQIEALRKLVCKSGSTDEACSPQGEKP